MGRTGRASIKAASKFFQSIFQTTGGKPPLLMLFTKNTRDELVLLISILACTDFFPSYLGDLVFSLLGLLNNTCVNSSCSLVTSSAFKSYLGASLLMRSLFLGFLLLFTSSPASPSRASHLVPLAVFLGRPSSQLLLPPVGISFFLCVRFAFLVTLNHRHRIHDRSLLSRSNSCLHHTHDR